MSAEAPIYVPHFDDCFCLNTFIHIKLSDQDDGTTTVCQLVKHNGQVCLCLFFPLFPTKKLQCHPEVPSNSAHKILDGIGSRNIELYKSNRKIIAENLLAKEIKIRFPAFVFTTDELKDPSNSWAHGLANVYIVRYKEPPRSRSIPFPSLVPLEENESTCFPMDHIFEDGPMELCAPPRCFHRNVWTGLYLLRKGLIKLLNKRGRQSEEIDCQSLNIGAIPTETFNYLFVLANSNFSAISFEQTQKNESYLQVDPNLTRKKFKMSYWNGTLRFQTPSDIDIVRRFLGIGAVYGSCENRPTLKHGEDGLKLKRGHFLTYVNATNDSEGPPFKKRSSSQRIDLSFSSYNVRLTIAFQRYRFDVSRSGELRTKPESEHLTCLLSSSPYDADRFQGLMPPKNESEFRTPEAKGSKPTSNPANTANGSNESDGSSSFNQSPTDSGTHYSSDPTDLSPKDSASKDTFRKILEDSSSTDETSVTTLSPVNKGPIVNPNAVAHKDAKLSDYPGTSLIGRQFYDEGSVYDILCTIPPSEKVRKVYLHKEDLSMYHSPEECPQDMEILDHIGTLKSASKDIYVAMVCGGLLYDSDRHERKQKVGFYYDEDALLRLVLAFE